MLPSRPRVRLGRDVVQILPSLILQTNSRRVLPASLSQISVFSWLSFVSLLWSHPEFASVLVWISVPNSACSNQNFPACTRRASRLCLGMGLYGSMLVSCRMTRSRPSWSVNCWSGFAAVSGFLCSTPWCILAVSLPDVTPPATVLSLFCRWGRRGAPQL